MPQNSIRSTLLLGCYFPCSAWLSHHLNKYPYFLSPIVATHYSFVLCVLYGGLEEKDMLVKKYGSGKTLAIPNDLIILNTTVTSASN